MLLAVLTTFFIGSAIVIVSSFKGAIEVDENLKPVSTVDPVTQHSGAGLGKSMIFKDFSTSRSVA
ncbi:hypothetical protein BH10BAC2_BH10BAC2_45970 [soil metagenome]